MSKKKNEELKEDVILQCRNDIIGILRKYLSVSVDSYVPYAACLLSIAVRYNDPFAVTFEQVVEEVYKLGIQIEDVVLSEDLKEGWQELRNLCQQYNAAEFKKTATLQIPVTDKREESETPKSLAKLAAKILDINPQEHVADLCCGKGSAMLELYKVCPDAKVCGYETNRLAAGVAGIHAYAMDSNICVKTCDVFNLPEQKVNFDKIFSNYPFGMNLRQLGAGQRYRQSISNKVPAILKATSSDWVFNCLMIDLLKEDGKAVAIMTNGSTWNTIDADIRRYFVEQGLIECIISLPAKLFSSTNISTAMIVFSRRNDSVRMIDASDLCVKGRRQNIITDEFVERIYEMRYVENEISRMVSSEEIKANDYVLNPGRYFIQKESSEYTVPFESVIKSISRGAHCSAEQLDAMDSKEPTNMQFLKTSDIRNGMIVGPLQYLSYIEGNFEKYCIKDRSLVISKMGSPAYKVAVATVEDGYKLLANANLYVIELDESKVDPYYLKAFLESSEGQAKLRNITVGAVVMSIGVKDLKAMMIPLPPMEQQKRISERYKEAMDEVIKLRAELQMATEHMNHVFEQFSQ